MAGTQVVVLAAAFLLLWAAPLPDGFFSDYGAVAGPVSWLVCSAVTARREKIPLKRALIAAAAGGGAAALAGLAVNHTLGLVAGVAVFAAACATEPESRSRPPAPRPRASRAC